MMTATTYRFERKSLLAGLALMGGAFTAAIAAWAVWSFSTLQVIALSAGIIILLLMALAPEKRLFILGATIFVIPLNIDQSFMLHPSPGGADSLSFGLFEIFLILLLLATLVHMASAKKAGAFQLFPAILVPSVAVLAFYLISLINARDFMWSLFDIVNYCKVILFFLLLANNITCDRDLKVVLIASLLALIMQTLIASWQNFNPDITDTMLRFKLGVSSRIVFEQGVNPFVRSGGTFGNANHLGRYFGLVLPTAIILVLSPVSSRSLKIVGAAASLVGLFSVINTLSRSAWAGMVLAIIVMLPLMLKHRLLNYRSLIIMSLALLMFITMLIPLSGKIWDRLTLDDHGSAMTRITTSRVAFRIIADHPFIGCGINNYGAMLADYWIGEDTFTRKAAVHNNFLLYLAEIGFLGFTAFLALLISFWSRIRRAIKSSSLLHKAVAVSFMGAFWAMLLESLSDKSYKENFSLLLTFWGMMAIIEAINRMQDASTLGFKS